MNSKNDDLTDALQGLDGNVSDAAPSAEELTSELGEDSEGDEPVRGSAELAHVPEMPVPASYRKAPQRSSNPVSVKDRKRLIVLITGMGAVLLIPGIWATALLMGLDVPGAHKDNAQGMAKMMLICWPLAVLLFIFAGWLWYDLRRMKAAARRARQ